MKLEAAFKVIYILKEKKKNTEGHRKENKMQMQFPNFVQNNKVSCF